MNLQITQHHINEGKSDKPLLCPIALALSEAFPQYTWEVWGSHIHNKTEETGSLFLFKAPGAVQNFVDMFDDPRDDEDLQPCTLNIPMPWEAL